MITTMINEDYVSFETAKLLKDKGFSELTTKAYPYFEGKDYKYDISCPTHQRALKWLRKLHNISIEPFVDFGSGDEHWWTADVRYIKKDGLIDELCGYNSYEEAAEAALKYTLENLI